MKEPPSYAEDTTKVIQEIERLAHSGRINSDWYMLCLQLL